MMRKNGIDHHRLRLLYAVKQPIPKKMNATPRNFIEGELKNNMPIKTTPTVQWFKFLSIFESDILTPPCMA
jgi:hypothetical protein